ncbi:MAG: T9SS type A sorting domain-containing protein, partial [Lacibacter sp.]
STPNDVGGWGMALAFASDSSLYAISSTSMTVYHYNLNSLPLSVGERSENQLVYKIFPNPFTSTVSVEFSLADTKDIAISIIDLSGRTVLTIPKNKVWQGVNKISFDLSELPNGIYFLTIKSKKGLQTVKLVKNK